jgi:hypothetical protein
MRRRVIIVYRRFGTVCRSHLQGSRALSSRTLDSWRWDRYVVPKRRYAITTRRRVISQKIADLINIATEAWNQGMLVKCTSRYPTYLHSVFSIQNCCCQLPQRHFGGPHLVDCPKLLIQYMGKYPTYLLFVRSIQNCCCCQLPQRQCGVPHPVGCPKLVIEYTSRYSTYLQSALAIYNFSTRYITVTGTHLTCEAAMLEWLLNDDLEGMWKETVIMVLIFSLWKLRNLLKTLDRVYRIL